jgi:hypothetical protein
LERENSELKAGQLMGMFGGKQAKALERQVETLKLQLSEKTNEILRMRDENEQLRAQVEEQTQASVASLNPVVDEMVQDQRTNVSMLEHSMELEDPKYRLIEQSLREKDEEVERL